MNKQNNGCIVAIIIAVILVIGFWSMGTFDHKSERNYVTDSIKNDSSFDEHSVDSIIKSKCAISNWTYDSKLDEMSDKYSFWAVCTSNNSVDFDFPYDGGSVMRICFRKTPKYGRDAYIEISSGQFNGGVDGCIIRVRSDNGNVKKFSCSLADDGSTNMVFINSYNSFLNCIRKAKNIKIEAPFYNAGSQIFSFSVSGLKWDH